MDLGDVRIGIAQTDAEQRVATAHATLEAATTEEAIAAQIVAIAAEVGSTGIVVGYPRTLQGREGTAAARARRIAVQIRELSEMPVILWDERFTTVEAERIMLEQDASRRERRANIDRVAATIILGSVLESRRMSRKRGN